MVDILNKFDILTEKLIKAGKSHSLLRIPAFIAVMMVVLAEGIYEIGRKISHFLFKRKFLSKALSLAVAWLMFAPFYQPAVIYATEGMSQSSESSEETTIPEQTAEETTAPEESDSEETTAPSEETTASESSDTSSPEETIVPSETTVPEETTEETRDTSVTPSETEMPEETEIPEETTVPEETTTEETTPPLMMMSVAPARTIEIKTFDQLEYFLSNKDSDGNSVDSEGNPIDNSNAHVILKNDIDGNERTLSVMPSFSGTFDGQGYVIKNVTFGRTTLTRDSVDDMVQMFSGMFKNFNGTMINVGFDTVEAYTNSSHGRAAVVAYEGSGEIYNCYIANSTIKAPKGTVGTFGHPNQSASFSVSNCHVNGNADLDALNNNAEGNGWKPWYKDTAPNYSNHGYPSMKPTISVEFYKSDGVRFEDDDLSFTTAEGTANADTYAIVLENENGNKILLPDEQPSPKGKKFMGWALESDLDPENPEDAAKILVYKDADSYGSASYEPHTAKSAYVKTVNGKEVIQLYAVWGFNPSYTLSFLDHAGNKIDLDPNENTERYETDSIDAGTKFSGPFPQTTYPDGYESDGWYRTDTGAEWILEESTMQRSEYVFDETLDENAEQPPKEIELREKIKEIEYTITLDGAEDEEFNEEIPTKYTITTDTFTIPNPERTGYTFIGWKNGDADPDNSYEVTIGSTGNITLTAQWEIITYSITYNIPNANWVEENGFILDNFISYNIKDGIVLPTEQNIHRDYYEFKGWKISGECTQNGNTVTSIPSGTYGNAVATAVWSPKPYDITYVHIDTEREGNDKTPEYSPVTNNSPVKYDVENHEIILDTPTCSGYTFLGWEYDGQTFNGGDTITLLEGSTLPEGIVITGKWEPTEYNVTKFDANGGVWRDGYNPSTNTTYTITTGFTLPDSSKIKKDCYEFEGWQVSAEGYKGGEESVYAIPKGTYGDATVTAVWDPIKYDITLAGVDGIDEPLSIPSEYDITDAFLLPTPTKEGYDFLGWKAVADGYDNNGNFPQDDYVAEFKNNFGNVTLTAEFKIKEYTVSFDTNGGTPEIASVTAKHGTLISAPSQTLTKEGYDFTEKWFVDEECTEEFDFSEPIKSDMTIYAGWEIQKFNVIFANADTDDITDVPYGSTIDRPANPEKASTEVDGKITNYRFLGWFSDAGCTKVFDFSTPIKSDTTVYAKWLDYTEDKPLTLYNISYKANTDSEDTFSIGDFAKGEQIILPKVPDDTINHKVFKGFVIDGDTSAKPVVYKAGSVFTVGDKDVMFIVVWDTEKHTVTFNSDGGTEIAPQVIEYNQKATAPSCEKRGFILKGWFTEDGTQFSFDTPITEDIVLKAEWEEIVIPETPVRPGSSGSSGVKYDKTIRITDIPDGITAPAELFKATTDMDNFSSSIDVRITNASESAEDELIRLLRLQTNIPDEDIFIFDISLYERGTDRKITLPEDTTISLTIPVCDKFTSNLEKVRIVSVHEGKLVVYPEPYISSSGRHLLVNFSSDKFSTFAFVLDKNDEITDLSASAPSAIAAEMMLYTPPAMIPAMSGIIVNGKTKLRISRKRKVYKVVTKFH